MHQPLSFKVRAWHYFGGNAVHLVSVTRGLYPNDSESVAYHFPSQADEIEGACRENPDFAQRLKNLPGEPRGNKH